MPVTTLTNRRKKRGAEESASSNKRRKKNATPPVMTVSSPDKNKNFKPLSINHRLFSHPTTAEMKPRGGTSSKARDSPSVPTRARHPSHGTARAQSSSSIRDSSPASDGSYSSEDENKPNYNEEDVKEDDFEPIYKGSIAHIVLEKVGGLETSRLVDYPDSEEDDKVPGKAKIMFGTETSKSEINKIKRTGDPAKEGGYRAGNHGKEARKARRTEKTDKSTRRGSIVPVNVVMPEIIFRADVEPQKCYFREGDRVSVRQNDQTVGVGECTVAKLFLFWLFPYN